jgi:hypothetical protein
MSRDNLERDTVSLVSSLTIFNYLVTMDKLNHEQHGEQKPKAGEGFSKEDQAELDRLTKIMQESPEPTPEEMERVKIATEHLK